MAELLKPDLCIIGAGAAGLAAAHAGRALGASVIVIERGQIGGDLNLGSIPSKALIAAAHRSHALRTAAGFGLANDEPKLSLRATQGHIKQVVDALAIDQSVEHLAALGIQVIAAEARFIDRKTVEAGDTLIQARRFILATGSQPSIPSIKGLTDIGYFTSDTIFDNAKKLTHLVVIGGGPLGIELAQAFVRFGSQVTLVEPTTVLAQSDRELVDLALRRLREEGVDVREHTSINEIIARSQGIGIRISGPDGSEESLDASHILVTAGRVAKLQSLNLEKAKILMSKRDPSRLALKNSGQTSNRRVYAIGDAAGGGQQVLSAVTQANVAVRRALLGFGSSAVTNFPRAIYCDPELAEVGMSEGQVRKRFKTRFRIVRTAFAENERANTTRQTYGVAKMICALDGRILGAGIIGPGAGELIGLFTLAIANGLSAQQLKDFVAPYPSLSDIAHQLGVEFMRDTPMPWWVKPAMSLRRYL